MKPKNMHATAIILGDRGVLIAGDSGSGKTALALALIAEAKRGGMFARLVSDDQVFLSNHAGRLVCNAPSTISGMVEVRGLGPRPVAAEPSAVVDLLVRLAPADAAERFPEDATATLAGVPVACLDLAERNVVGATAAVAARLSLPPFA
ncbi:HPr kinase/phosphorylase [Mesorhizobium sp. WSM2239]|uniref:HPr kinase/phosphorylase n=2 Tax=unclassified Mesorhizobium TaxID=325217 RepID=A0AAU8DD05_9HYPH